MVVICGRSWCGGHRNCKRGDEREDFEELHVNFGFEVSLLSVLASSNRFIPFSFADWINYIRDEFPRWRRLTTTAVYLRP